MNKPDRIYQAYAAVLQAAEHLHYALVTLRDVGESPGFEEPLSRGRESLNRLARRIKAVEDRQRKRLLIGNPALTGEDHHHG